MRRALCLAATAATVLSAVAWNAGTAGAAARSTPDRPGHVDVLFIGAHPDDEAGDLAAFGQWNEYRHTTAGVVTITRGEGGGNAVGPEEGPPLGLLREGEERRAVGMADMHDIHYLDKVDFFYTVSAPLTDQIWGHQNALSRVVRLVRETTPKVIVTMNPAPVPGQHGNHQVSGRLATEAFHAAADPHAFRSQLTDEHLRPWAAGRLFRQGADGDGPDGPTCSTAFAPTDPSEDVYGVWSGTYSRRHRTTWAQVDVLARRQYASQGYAGVPDAPSDPAKIGCNYFTQIESRVPFTVGNRGNDAMLEGAVTPARGGLPLGTRFALSTDRYHLTPGATVTVTARAQAAARHSLHGARVALRAPAGWAVHGSGRIINGAATFRLRVPATATVNKKTRLTASLHIGRSNGQTDRVVSVEPVVRATPQLLPQVADYQSWTAHAGEPQIAGAVKPVLSLGSGTSRAVAVTVTNGGSRTESGRVTLALPKGFTADAASRPYGPLAAGKSVTVPFRVTNSDPALPTANQGPDDGDYDYTITTTNGTGARDVTSAGLELVPTTTIPRAGSAPKVDGTAAAGEYTGPVLSASRNWEGTPCTSATDCSATFQTAWYGGDLYVVAHIVDDVLGTKLTPADCKRHWRTDSVEINLDPRGTSENTATTFKTGILPATTVGGPCFERDADNHQGPGAQTAPGMQVASKLTSPYRGYTVEAKIPFADLPAAVDPQRLGLNVLVYDSDTQDKTGQTRNAWSPFGGVQGDPYRWGQATVAGYTAPPGTPTTPADPVIPQTAARSIDSPQSVLQAATIGVPLAGDAAAPRSDSARLVGRSNGSGAVVARIAATGPGTAHLYVWNGKLLGQRTVHIGHAGRYTVRVPATGARRATLLLAFAAQRGGTVSSAR